MENIKKKVSLINFIEFFYFYFKQINFRFPTYMAESIICSNCNEKIEDGEYVNLDPKFFHIAHFTCKTCSISIFII